MKWRFIPFTYYDPFLKTAFNDISLNLVSKNNQPIFWLAGWDKNCINLGAGQNYELVLNTKKIEEDSLLVIRRQGGGGATYLSKEGEISWAMIIPKGDFQIPKLKDFYEKNLDFLISSLKSLGISAKYKSVNDVITDKGKISGSSLKVGDKAIYFAGTLLYSIDKSKLNKYLRPENDNLKKSLKENEKKITSISNEVNTTFEKVLNTLKQEFLKGKEYEILDWNQEELSSAKKLAKIYSKNSWIKYGKL